MNNSSIHLSIYLSIYLSGGCLRPTDEQRLHLSAHLRGQGGQVSEPEGREAVLEEEHRLQDAAAQQVQEEAVQNDGEPYNRKRTLETNYLLFFTTFRPFF